MKILVSVTVRLLVESICEILKDEKKIEVFTNETIQNENPDIVLVDLNSLTTDLKNRYPQAKFVLIDTGLRKEQLVEVLTSYSLSGLIATYTDIPLFKKALKVINEGQIWIDNALVKALMHEPPNVIKKFPADISQREREIIQYVCQGLTNKEVAHKIGVSEQTVKTHLNRIFKKLGISNRFQLVSIFLDRERKETRTAE
ncbi:MAG: response regulator transcription factor [Deltaproteobacteria bacterium]|nr:response regulator transcription factor [Deltaproteobacteria bacterium]